MVRWCCVNFQCRGVLLFWIIVGQGPTAIAVGAGGRGLAIFLSSITPLLSPSLWETARYRLKYCLKGPFYPKTAIQPVYPACILVSNNVVSTLMCIDVHTTSFLRHVPAGQVILNYFLFFKEESKYMQ